MEKATEKERKLIVSRAWIEDLRDLFFDWEHSHEEPVDRARGQKSTDEVWTEIEGMFDKINVVILADK